MDIEPIYTTIGNIFERNLLFEVPKYQRYYAWEEEQIDDFISDFENLFKAQKEGRGYDHFFGGIVCVEKSVLGSNRQQRELIDGQQRITTVMLLIAVLHQVYIGLLENESLNDEQISLIKSRKEKIIDKYYRYNDEINRKPQVVDKIVLSAADEEFFKKLIYHESIEPKRDSHQKLCNAYKKMKTFVNDVVLECEDVDKKLDCLADMGDIVDKHCSVILITTKTKSDAYALFQVLNDRGTGLTVGDLLKSKTLEVLEENLEYQNEILKEWDEILQYKPKEIESFLRYFYMSIIGKRAGGTSLYDDYLKNVFSMDDFSADMTREMIKQLYEENKKYMLFSKGEWPYDISQPVTAWDRNRLKILVDYLDYNITFALLLAACKLEQKIFSDMVVMLERFMFRFKGVCKNNHQVVGDLFMREAVYIREHIDTYQLSHLKDELRKILDKSASDEVFKVHLKEMKYMPKGNNKLLKYFFSTLEEYNPWYSNGGNGSPKCDAAAVIDFENVSIEHILSQNPTDEETVGVDIHVLKNLTILTLQENGKLAKNKSFTEKRAIYRSSSFKMNLELAKEEDWDEDAMNHWEEHILDMACKVFQV